MQDFVNSWWTIFSLLGIIIGVIAFLAYHAGLNTGARCKCCSFKMDCRFCVAAGCVKAQPHDELFE